MEEKDPKTWTPLERLQYLLDHWRDIFEPNVASSLSRTGGSGLDPRLPKMAHDHTVVELQRCLSNLAVDDPAAHKHLKAFRCNAEWRQVRAMVRVQLTSGRWDEIPGWRRERIVPSWISGRLVLRAEEYIERAFQGQVFIPKDLWDGLTEPVVSA